MDRDDDELIDDKIYFNGIDAVTGQYLFDPLTSSELAELAQGRSIAKKEDEREHLAELEFRVAQSGRASFGVKEGIDAAKLEETGWGAIFPAVKPGTDEERAQSAIYEALQPLLALRRRQASKNKEHYYKEYRGVNGYRPGEKKQQFLARL